MLSFFNFFMNCVFSAPITELIKFNFALDKLFVLAGPVVYTLTRLAREFD